MNHSLFTHCVQKAKAIACGEDHTVVLTSEGGVFTFGHGQFGQLGHNTTNNEVNPKKVFELMGRTVTQIAAGRRHTITYDQSCGHILSFGLGANGQLGYLPSSASGQRANQLLPVLVQVRLFVIVPVFTIFRLQCQCLSDW